MGVGDRLRRAQPSGAGLLLHRPGPADPPVIVAAEIQPHVVLVVVIVGVLFPGRVAAIMMIGAAAP